MPSFTAFVYIMVVSAPICLLTFWISLFPVTGHSLVEKSFKQKITSILWIILVALFGMTLGFFGGGEEHIKTKITPGQKHIFTILASTSALLTVISITKILYDTLS